MAIARDLVALGFKVIATRGTANMLSEQGVTAITVNKVTEGSPHIVDVMKSGGVHLVINTVGPVWEGNQVWLVLGGGAIFAAWPPLYAVSFSGFYLAVFAMLFGLILRPVGFKYRSKLPSKRWRDNWDRVLFIGGLLPGLIAGVAVGNVLLGVPFHFDDTLRVTYTGSFFGLLTPFALIAGLISVAMLVSHGAAMLVIKTDGPVAERAARYGSVAAKVAD